MSSLLVWRLDSKPFNLYPLTVIEWACDIIAIIGFFAGFAMLFFDINRDSKAKIKEAILEANDDIRK